MTNFTKEEIKKVGLILTVLLALSLISFSGSLRKARDAQRNADLTYLKEKLDEYHSEIGYFPAAGGDGTILACKDRNTIVNLEFKRLENPAPCKWGEDSLVNYFSDTPKTILEKLPIDPSRNKDMTYIYKSSESRFQLYASLEGANEAEYNKKIASLKLKCGKSICNFGKAFSDTPLNMSIKDYETQLLNK